MFDRIRYDTRTTHTNTMTSRQNFFKKLCTSQNLMMDTLLTNQSYHNYCSSGCPRFSILLHNSVFTTTIKTKESVPPISDKKIHPEIARTHVHFVVRNKENQNQKENQNRVKPWSRLQCPSPKTWFAACVDIQGATCVSSVVVAQFMR